MNNPLANMLMQQLKMRNPQMFQFISQAQKNQSNPQEILSEITKNYKPEQMKGLINTAKSFGFTDEQLSQYGINLK